jgi:hypothetical protein
MAPWRAADLRPAGDCRTDYFAGNYGGEAKRIVNGEKYGI